MKTCIFAVAAVIAFMVGAFSPAMASVDLSGLWYIRVVAQSMAAENQTFFETDTEIEIMMCKKTIRNTIIRPSIPRRNYAVLKVESDTIRFRLGKELVNVNIKNENLASNIVYIKSPLGFPREVTITMMRTSRNVTHPC